MGILSESKKLSTNVRPPGRPPKTMAMPRPPIVLRADPVDHEASSRLLSRSNSSLSDAIKDDDQMRARERELAMEEAKLKEYQERVLRYERLAEEATKVALKDKELRLKKLAEDLRERELQAKKRLQSAVESINVGKSEPLTENPDQTLARIMSFERQSPDPEEVQSNADTELPETSEINAAQVDPKHSILPEPEEKDLIEDEIIAAEPTPKLPQVLASSTLDQDQSAQLVVNNSANLESLVSRASRGEVTLVAQASADGTYILVENTQEAISDAIQADQETITDEVVTETPAESQVLEQSPKVQEEQKPKEIEDSAYGVPIKVHDDEPEMIVQDEIEGMDQDPNETDQSDHQVEQTPIASPKRKREEDQEEGEPDAKKSKSSPNEEED